MPTAMYSIYATVGLHVTVPGMPVLQLYEFLRPSHIETVRGGGRSKEIYGLNRAEVGGSSRGP